MKKTKQEVQEEINVINAFGVGIGITLTFLAIYLYFGLKPTEIVYPIVFVFIAILVRTIILKRRLK